MALSERQYDARRKRIRDEYETSMNRAGAKRDRELSYLFVQSGWTQQRIAEKEGRSREWVCKRLRFGRFIDFLGTTVPNGEKLPVDLSERKFRGFWESTASQKQCAKMSEEEKFQAIFDSDEWQVQFAIEPPFPTNDLIAEHCCDNRYRTREEICDEIDAPEDFETRMANAIGPDQGTACW